jgi:DNA helicase IV
VSSGEMDGEQKYLTRLYERLDRLRDETRSRLDEVLVRSGLGHQGLAERDVTAAELAQLLTRLDAVENGLCFGRIDLRDGEHRHIGRIGIRDDLAFQPLLIDWRAPAARPFYTATAISPENVRRRRHIGSSGRKVTAVKDEEFGSNAEISGDGALIEALNAARTGRMTDIVATIQAEQDEIIRSRPTGVLVVQGGPGTGKTAVALHRAAYLLYTQRERLARSVVLIVGPNPTFLRYIGEVLPSLGETGVLLATVEELYPGVRADRAEGPEAAEIKGRLAMAGILAAAVRDRQRVPDEPLAVEHDRETLTLDPETVADARRRARESLLPHNEARPLFRSLIIDALARRLANRLADRLCTDVPDDGGLSDLSGLIGEEDVEDIRRELDADPEVAAVVERLWPALTPQRLLAELYASPERLAAAAPGLTGAERAALLRPLQPPGGARGWSAADVPLLDEAAELLGTDERLARLAAEAEAAERAERLTLAQEALDIAYGSRTTDIGDGDGDGDGTDGDGDAGADAELLSAYDLLDAEQLAERHREADHRTPAERAAADRTWAFGHVVVDEAQELSPMAWRMLMRRCPARSMTVVGDIAQASGVAATSSWEAVLAPHVGARWRLAELSVNYRLPSEIAEVAAGVLCRIAPGLRAPGAVRSGGVTPWRRSVPERELAARAAELAARAAAEVSGGRVGVIAPASRLAEVTSAVTGTALAPAEGGGRVDVLDPATAKGLEFDAVIVVDPDRIVTGSPRGLNDLYVALTRPTQRLGVLHPGGPPALLDGLRRLA